MTDNARRIRDLGLREEQEAVLVSMLDRLDAMEATDAVKAAAPSADEKPKAKK